ncbi:hypothetical protein pb186bvf_014337 [Paramecium bursaria]
MKKLGQFLSYKFSKIDISHIPQLKQFLSNIPDGFELVGPRFFIETYGCQMNSNDTSIVTSILKNNGYQNVQDIDDAEIVLLNTCAIRANAEEKIIMRLQQLKNSGKILGLLGCMAERLKQDLYKFGAHVVVGPDGYRTLPELLLTHQETKQFQSNTNYDFEETYDDIMPIYVKPPSSFVSIMRGCNNMCSFCIVPFTRGRERSRDPDSILKEIQLLKEKGIKEITLLGQNVNSYFYKKEEIESQHQNTEGFKELYKLRQGNGVRFDQLLEMVAKSFPEMRIRFISPHPKDFPDRVLNMVQQYPNIAKSIHIPCQSGSNTVLQRMRRNYTREALINLCKKARDIVPNVTLSTDVIVGFCGETEQDFQDTQDLMNEIKFENAFMFAYSMREKTHAHRNFTDDIPQDVKQQRLSTLIDQFHKIQKVENQKEIGRKHLVLVESHGKKENQMRGKSDTYKTVVIEGQNLEIGQLQMVEIQSANTKTLFGQARGEVFKTFIKQTIYMIKQLYRVNGFSKISDLVPESQKTSITLEYDNLRHVIRSDPVDIERPFALFNTFPKIRPLISLISKQMQIASVDASSDVFYPPKIHENSILIYSSPVGFGDRFRRNRSAELLLFPFLLGVTSYPLYMTFFYGIAYTLGFNAYFFELTRRSVVRMDLLPHTQQVAVQKIVGFGQIITQFVKIEDLEHKTYEDVSTHHKFFWKLQYQVIDPNLIFRDKSTGEWLLFDRDGLWDKEGLEHKLLN